MIWIWSALMSILGATRSRSVARLASGEADTDACCVGIGEAVEESLL